MDILELIKTRRSVRKFDSTKPVDEDTVRKILDAAIWAPSAGNTQCWKFYVVRDPKIKHRLAVEAGHQAFIDDAPVLIIVCADLDHIEKSYGDRGRKTYSLQDTAAAIQNMMLVSHSLGLSSCWVGAFSEDKARSILDLPKGVRPVSMIPIGVPKEHPKAPPRKALDDVTKYL